MVWLALDRLLRPLGRSAHQQKVRAVREKSGHTTYKRAEAETLKQADLAKRQANGLPKQADSHRKHAEEIRRKAEGSWKAYQAATRPATTPKPTAPAKPAEAPKVEPPKVEEPKPDAPDKKG